MPKLRLLDSDHPAEFDLADDVVTIGRAPTNSIQLQDPSSSKEHAQIVAAAGSWRIIDSGSRNGTYVNGERIRSHHLVAGDRIQIGQTELLMFEGSEARLVVEESLPEPPQGAPNVISIPVFEPIKLDRDGPAGTFAGGAASMKAELRDLAPEANLAERKLRLIQAVGEKLIQYMDNEKLAAEIIQIVIAQTGADRGFLCLFDTAGNHVPLASAGLAPNEEMRISRTVMRRLQTEKSGILVVPNADGDPAVESLRRMNVKSTLCVPLWTSDRIMGFISLDSTTPQKAFSKEHLDLLIAIAHQAAIGIERGRLAKQSAQANDVRNYLSKYLDSKIVQHILRSGSGEDPLEPKETEVTVMFTDIVSFTKMSEGMAPTELAAFVREYLTAMTDIIFLHGGTIDKYIGDGIMALFGAPIANKGASEAAIRAALAMKECVENERGKKVRVTVGIATGRAVVGNIGSEQRMEYTALGDTVNVASRLQGFARPNEICIEEETFRQGGDLFAVQEIGTIDVKNRVEPVQVYKVLGEMSADGRSTDWDTVQ